jgi:hypothetical protein
LQPSTALLLVEDQRIVVRFTAVVRALVSDREHLAGCRHDAMRGEPIMGSKRFLPGLRSVLPIIAQ